MAVKHICGYLMLCGCLMFVLGGCAASTMHSQDDPLAIRKDAVLAYREGNFDKAVSKFEQLVAMIPKDSELWFRLGNSYGKAGKPDEAITAYRNALLRNPELGKAWYNMGIIHMQEALKAFLDMQKYLPPDDPATVDAEKKLQGLLLLLGGDQQK